MPILTVYRQPSYKRRCWLNRVSRRRSYLTRVALHLLSLSFSSTDIVVPYLNSGFQDATTMGNVLADYIDAGGVVVGHTYLYGQFVPIQGRFVTGGYSPYNIPVVNNFTNRTLGTFDSSHPLMQGVTALASDRNNDATLVSGASLVASWNTGAPLIAVQTVGGHTSVGVTAYVGNYGVWSGNFARVIVNAGRWLRPSGCPSPTPTPTPTSTPTPTPTPTPGACLLENFDGVTAPTLPAGWMATNFLGNTIRFVTSTSSPFSPPNSLALPDQSSVSDKVVETPGVTITSPTTQLTFRHSYDMELSDAAYDGCVLEVSSPNINGGAYTDILAPAVGGSFVTGGYDVELFVGSGNPIEGREAWGWPFRRRHRRLHHHDGKSRTQRQRADDQATLSHGDRPVRRRSRLAN